jgi:predicted exporter
MAKQTISSSVPTSTKSESLPLIWGVSFQKIYRILLFCFLIVAITATLLFGFQISRGLHFNTDLRSLLPTAAEHALQQAAADRLVDLGGNQTVLMVAAENVIAVKQAAGSIIQGLAESRYWTVNKRAVDSEQFQQYVSVLQEHRFQLLSKKQRTQLQDQGFAPLAEQALNQLYQPSGWVRFVPPSDDPLNLFGQWFGEQQTGLADLNLQDGYLLTPQADEQGRWYGIILAELKVDPFAMSTQQLAVGEINTVFAALPDSVIAIRSGVLFHAAAAASNAKREVSVIALGSVIGIVLLYLLSFRSLWPLALSLCAIAFGSLVAFSIVHALFSEIHLITLVFGASLIGVAVDYALHFLSRLYHVQTNYPDKEKTTPRQAIVSVFPGITLGLVTTVVGYLCLIQSDMPGLYQIALFSIIGLIAAWLFVVAIFPIVFKVQPINQYRALTRLSAINVSIWNRVGRHKVSYLLSSLLPVLIIFAVMGQSFSKDVRTLYRPSQSLLSEGQTVQRVLNAFAPNQFFVVTGETSQAVLELEESFQQQLDSLVAEGAISSFDAVSKHLPSINKQRENYKLLKEHAYGAIGGAEGGVESFMQAIGVEQARVAAHLADFTASDERFLSLASWLTAAPLNLRSFWLGNVEGREVSVITLSGINDVAALRRAAVFSEQLYFVDRVEDISLGLLENSRQAAKFLMLAYAVISLFLLLRYRQLSALLLISIPLFSSLLVLAVFNFLGTAISLFHIFGLFLVLGLGMDYGLFIREATVSGQAQSSVLKGGPLWIAINLSAITSCLSFGLMSLSSTPMVSAFGMTVLIGSLCNLLLVPLVCVLTSSVKGEN